jgi:alkylation response protein AidB-like acyl-CoA dehydrogenase
MNFEPNSEHDAFRAEVRRFFEDHLPPDLARRTYIGAHPPAVEDYRTCQRMLNSRGWGAPHWPVEWGGTTWSAMKRHVFMEELYEADVLDYGWQGTHMIGPVIIAFGSDAQRRRFLPPMIKGDEYWCQGFSEPNAGSDLASLRTRAQLVGQEWVISGQKIWTSDAHYADWGFFLVRTDTSVKPQRGLSLLLVPMNSAGVRVRPIESIHGGHDLNEVFLDDVRVPAGNIVGEAGKGWTYAKYLLDKERTASASLYQNKRELEKVKVIARQETIDDRRLIDTPAFARKIALIEADMLALQWSVLRLLAEEKNSHDPDAVVSALKIRGSELLQRVSQLQIEALGPRALRAFGHGENAGAEVLLGTPEWPAHVPGRTAQFLYLRAATIFGGSREIQKNIIAKRAFGL